MRRFAILMFLAACGTTTLDAPPQASNGAISMFVADVSPDLSAGDQAVVASCGAQNTSAEELQQLAGVQVLDAATTGLISEIMTRDGTLACMQSNGVAL